MTWICGIFEAKDEAENVAEKMAFEVLHGGMSMYLLWGMFHREEVGTNQAEISSRHPVTFVRDAK
jgi:hypothetical protein